MFPVQNKIIIVDNNPEHLKILSEKFHANGIGCRELEYDPMYNEPLVGVRVAFFDINLLNQGGSENNIFNVLAEAIKNYISIENGPFALIFWTSNGGMIQRFKEFVQARHTACPRPFVVKWIDKDEFLENEEGNLEAKLEEVLSDQVLKLMFDFEITSGHAAYEVVNEIYKIIPKKDNWGFNHDFKLDFERIFSKVAIQALGKEHAINYCDQGITEALLSVLNHKMVRESANREDWKRFLNSVRSENLEYPVGFDEGRLNTIFHIDNNDQISHDTRGAVYEYKIDESILKKVFINISTFFKCLEQEDNSHFSRFVAIKHDSRKKSFIKDKSKYILIEISASCDYSQNKKRNNKYVMGLLAPEIIINEIDKNRMGESIFYRELPKFNIDGENYRLFVNFNFLLSEFKVNKNVGAPLFIFKKEIVDFIGNRYANHISRIGVTTF